MDGISWQLVLRDISTYYQRKIPKPSLAPQYVDFSKAQRNKIAMSTDTSKSEMKFWKSEFPEPLEPLPLFPFSRTRVRKTLTRYDVHTQTLKLGTDLNAKIRRVCSKEKVTPFHFHLSSLQVLLHRLLLIDDICIGIAHANYRDEEFAETVGFMVNLLPLRFMLQPDGHFGDVLQHTRRKALAALSNSRIPFDALLAKLQMPRDPTCSPLFQVALNYIVGATNTIPFGESTLVYDRSEEAKHAYDLAVTVREDPDGSALLSFTAQEYLYHPDDISNLIQLYTNLIDSLSSNQLLRVCDYEIFQGSLVQRAIGLGNGPDDDNKWPETLSLRITDIVLQNPEKIALEDQIGSELTYADMQMRVQSIANVLLAAGAHQGSYVAVACEPVADTVCSLLAIWLIGAVYVPLEMTYPVERLAVIVSECNPIAVLCHKSSQITTAGLLGIKQAINVQEVRTSPSGGIKNQSEGTALAVVLYTSGSTGAPKGVMLTHSNLLTQISAVQSLFGFGRETVLQQSSMVYDASLFQIFTAIANGGTLIIASGRSDPAELASVILRENVTVTLAVPSEYSIWISHGLLSLRKCDAWRMAFCGGDKLTPGVLQAFSMLELPDLELINAYGPSEASITCTMAKIDYHGPMTEFSSGHASIGHALPNYRLYIVDENQRPLPIGWPGEICIGGSGVATGYLNNDAQTKRSFTQDTFTMAPDPSESRNSLYRTGDKGKMIEDGSIIFLGRMDPGSQIKLRGMRVELDDISNTILNSSKIPLAEAVVIKKGDLDPFLVAFIVFTINNVPQDVDGFLKSMIASLPLPLHMRPAVAVPLDKLPLTANGKIDKARLSSMSISRSPDTGKSVQLEPAEITMKKIWEDTLPATSSDFTIDKDSDFFSVGGNSILLFNLKAKIRNQHGLDLTLATLFQSSTLQQMASLITTNTTLLNPPHPPTINWPLETLPPSIPTFPPSPPPLTPPRTLLLTGATGFLGRALTQHLLSTPQITQIHCLAVRPTSSHLLPTSPKLTPHPGDLSHPTLNLAPSVLETLATTADAIIHNGATVSLLAPYPTLRAPNLEATKFLLGIAARRRIPFHYISSAGVLRLVPPSPTSSSSTYNEKSVSAFEPRDGIEGYTA
ncbi:MAG: hypothetical protein Q9195_007666, partial [Heterodermia aff. obscurata]